PAGLGPARAGRRDVAAEHSGGGPVNAWWFVWAAVAVALAWQVRHALRDDEAAPVAPVALDDTAPDTSLADWDTCELIWDMPAHDPDGDAGFDRLRQAIRDHREEEGA